MGIEIEKKFLVNDISALESLEGVHYVQGYLNSNPEKIVRVRICGLKGYITIKGKKTDGAGLEYEYEIPCAEAEELLDKLCDKPLVDKHRYKYEYKGKVWEIDVFHVDNEGLIIAEIELEHEGEAFSKPDWIGKEVTHDIRYSNSNLVKMPYRLWTKE